MTFSVIIATRNRCDDLRRTCLRLSSLQPGPDEVLICADGCTDGTAEMLSREFADFVLLENKTALGSVGSRDRLVRAATKDVIVCLDDDSYPLDPNFLAQLASIFAARPRTAVVSFPELREGGAYSHESKTTESKGHYVSSYANCAAAMRREAYLQQPGFPHFFVHMYEEPDFALQCYGAGYSVWFEPSLCVRHHLSVVGRSELRRHQQNARNELWSVLMRCPWPWLPAVALFRVGTQFRYACSQGVRWAICEPVWWFQAVAGIRNCIHSRSPIRWADYLAWMRLAKRPIFETNVRSTQLHPQSL